MKSRYLPLDILRAIAGLSVPVLHLLEGFGQGLASRFGGHIYFAVEFFLLLMGYMLAHAYDGRWPQMSLGGFFARRLRRIHPFVVSGLVLGLAVFAVQAAGGPAFFPWLKGASPGTFLLAVACSFLMIPAPGISILAPFNACSWTLYYEYLGNLLYGLVLRRIGIRTLAVMTLLAAGFTATYVFQAPGFCAPHGLTIAGGWSANPQHFHNGLVRLLFPLLFGMLLARLRWRIVLPPKVAAVAVGAVFAALLFVPMTWFGGSSSAHRIFECAVIFALLPTLILVGVGNRPVVARSRATRAVVYFAELSYPLYMSHYPLIEVHQWLVRTAFTGLPPLATFLLSAGEYAIFLAIAAHFLALDKAAG